MTDKTPPNGTNGHKPGFWNGTPRWLQWSFYAGIIATIVAVGSAVQALDTLEPYTPVTWGSLERWERMAQLEKQIVEQIDSIKWDQIIYRTKDLGFQISELKNTELSLLSVLAEDSSFNELNNLRRDRLEGVQAEINNKETELRTLLCLIDNRNNTASRC